jgi:hypothetical protein
VASKASPGEADRRLPDEDSLLPMFMCGFSLFKLLYYIINEKDIKGPEIWSEAISTHNQS